jgi:CheY-like chemotaxis protein
MTGEKTPAGGTTGQTILLAEDDPSIRLMMAATLRAEGYTVLDAADGPSAVALAGKFGVPVDLLVSDFVMPGMNGHEVAETLRPRFPAMKVLLVSAHIEEEPVQKAVQQEAFKKGAAFLQKPFRPDDLVRKVRAVLRGM